MGHIRGAYKEQNRIFRRDAQPQLIALTYVLFIIVCIEIIMEITMEIRDWHDKARRGHQYRTAFSMLHFGLVIRLRTIWILMQIFQGAWRWMWYNDDIHTWHAARNIQGAYKEQVRIFRRASQIQLKQIALTYVRPNSLSSLLHSKNGCRRAPLKLAISAAKQQATRTHSSKITNHGPA